MASARRSHFVYCISPTSALTTREKCIEETESTPVYVQAHRVLHENRPSSQDDISSIRTFKEIFKNCGFVGISQCFQVIINSHRVMAIIMLMFLRRINKIILRFTILFYTCKAQYTPPTPTRRNCFVASRRRRRCVHETQLAHDDPRRIRRCERSRWP